MTLEKAIKHCYKVLERDDLCYECKQEHLQLAKWLEKLQQLENLEEELGIDLITLFMVLKQDYIYFKTYYGWHNKFKIEKERITGLKYIDDNTLALFTDDYYGKEHIVYLKDYGIKWSLRKEDLEDED